MKWLTHFTLLIVLEAGFKNKLDSHHIKLIYSKLIIVPRQLENEKISFYYSEVDG